MMCLRKFKAGSVLSVVIGILSMAMLFTTGCRTPEERPLLDSRGPVPAPYADTDQERAEPEREDVPDIADSDEQPMPSEEGLDETEETEESEESEETETDLPDVDAEEEEVTYTVKKGDTLWGIAQKFDIRHTELAEFNDMDSDDMLREGEELQIPPGGRTEPKEQEGDSEEGKPDVETSGDTYKVQKGEHLWGIAQRHGVTVDELKAANDLTSDNIREGQELQLPTDADTAKADDEKDEEGKEEGEEAVVPDSRDSDDRDEEEGEDDESAEDDFDAYTEEEKEDDEEDDDEDDDEEDEDADQSDSDLPNELNHRLSEGETLSSIAEMYRTSEQAIKDANSDIEGDDDLSPGDEIVVPFE